MTTSLDVTIRLVTARQHTPLLNCCDLDTRRALVDMSLTVSAWALHFNQCSCELWDNSPSFSNAPCMTIFFNNLNGKDLPSGK